MISHPYDIVNIVIIIMCIVHHHPRYQSANMISYVWFHSCMTQCQDTIPMNLWYQEVILIYYSMILIYYSMLQNNVVTVESIPEQHLPPEALTDHLLMQVYWCQTWFTPWSSSMKLANGTSNWDGGWCHSPTRDWISFFSSKKQLSPSGTCFLQISAHCWVEGIGIRVNGLWFMVHNLLIII